MRDNGQGFMSDDYAPDVYLQVLSDPPSYISLMLSDPPNEIMMAILKDETQAHGSKYTCSHVFQTDLGKVDGYTKNAGPMLIKVDDYAQGFHLLEIFCAAMSITLSYMVYGMLTPLPFDRGKMVSSLPPHCPHAASLPISPRPFQASLVPVTTSIESIGRRLLLLCGPLLPMGSDKQAYVEQ